MNNKTLEFLEAHKSPTPSRWRDEAEWRRKNATWLKISQKIAITTLLKMKSDGITQQYLADRMGYTQQYVSKILKGSENLSLDTITRLEKALGIEIIKPFNQ